MLRISQHLIIHVEILLWFHLWKKKKMVIYKLFWLTLLPVHGHVGFWVHTWYIHILELLLHFIYHRINLVCLLGVQPIWIIILARLEKWPILAIVAIILVLAYLLDHAVFRITAHMLTMFRRSWVRVSHQTCRPTIMKIPVWIISVRFLGSSPLHPIWLHELLYVIMPL
jgi:hypothetical protein